MESNFEGLEMYKWIMPMDRAQREDENNEVICLVTMFTPRVMVAKMPEIVHFCIFCWWQQKISQSLGKVFKYT